MTQALLDQVSQMNDVFSTLQANRLDLVLDSIALHCLAAVLTAGCTVLLIRTASGTLNSRFLKHLAASVALNVIFRVGSVVYILVNLIVFFTRQRAEDTAVIKQIDQSIRTLDSTWQCCDITISLLGSWFLLTTWNLLRRYPKEGVDQSLYSGLTAVFGCLCLAILSNLVVITGPVQKYLWLILESIDVIAAASGLIMVGYQLRKTLETNIKSQNRVWQATVPGITVFTYIIWGSFQPLYPWFKGNPWYSILLVIAGVSAIIMTVILCSQTLEEKPQYESRNTTKILNKA